MTPLGGQPVIIKNKTPYPRLPGQPRSSRQQPHPSRQNDNRSERTIPETRDNIISRIGELEGQIRELREKASLTESERLTLNNAERELLNLREQLTSRGEAPAPANREELLRQQVLAGRVIHSNPQVHRFSQSIDCATVERTNPSITTLRETLWQNTRMSGTSGRASLSGRLLSAYIAERFITEIISHMQRGNLLHDAIKKAAENMEHEIEQLNSEFSRSVFGELYKVKPNQQQARTENDKAHGSDENSNEVVATTAESQSSSGQGRIICKIIYDKNGNIVRIEIIGRIKVAEETNSIAKDLILADPGKMLPVLLEAALTLIAKTPEATPEIAGIISEIITHPKQTTAAPNYKKIEPERVAAQFVKIATQKIEENPDDTTRILELLTKVVSQGTETIVAGISEKVVPLEPILRRMLPSQTVTARQSNFIPQGKTTKSPVVKPNLAPVIELARPVCPSVKAETINQTTEPIISEIFRLIATPPADIAQELNLPINQGKMLSQAEVIANILQDFGQRVLPVLARIESAEGKIAEPVIKEIINALISTPKPNQNSVANIQAEARLGIAKIILQQAPQVAIPVLEKIHAHLEQTLAGPKPASKLGRRILAQTVQSLFDRAKPIPQIEAVQRTKATPQTLVAIAESLAAANHAEFTKTPLTPAKAEQFIALVRQAQQAIMISTPKQAPRHLRVNHRQPGQQKLRPPIGSRLGQSYRPSMQANQVRREKPNYAKREVLRKLISDAAATHLLIPKEILERVGNHFAISAGFTGINDKRIQNVRLALEEPQQSTESRQTSVMRRVLAVLDRQANRGVGFTRALDKEIAITSPTKTTVPEAMLVIGKVIQQVGAELAKFDAVLKALEEKGEFSRLVKAIEQAAENVEGVNDYISLLIVLANISLMAQGRKNYSQEILLGALETIEKLRRRKDKDEIPAPIERTYELAA